MKTLIAHARAQAQGRSGQRAHKRIVDDVFATRDALEHAAENMLAEMAANGARVEALVTRNRELAKARTHARDVAGKIAAFFLPS